MTSGQQLRVAASSALICVGMLIMTAWGQVESNQPRTGSPTRDTDSAARQAILEGEHGRHVQRMLHDWLAVQRMYTQDEIVALRKELGRRIDRMSPRELEAFLDDLEQRLIVLTGPEADDARNWMAQFLATSRNAEQRLREKRPDVLNMSADEIRRELQNFQQQRSARQQAQAAFDRQRALQVDAAQSWQAKTSQGRQRAVEQSSRAATHAPHGRYAPRREMQPAPFFAPAYTVGPWGAPVRWHPLAGYW